MTKLRFQTYPQIQSPEERDYALLGLAWAFHPYANEVEVHVDIAPGLSPEPELPASLDPKTLAYFKAGNIVAHDSREQVPSHALMLQKNIAHPPWALSRIDIDRDMVSHHLWQLQKLLAEFFGDMKHKDDGTRLRELRAQGFERAYLFGSGPTISTLDESSLDGGVRIICNGVVLNREANRLIRPQILVAIDPLHHCGISGYAGHFVDATRELMDEYGTLLVTRKEFVPWYRDRLPQDRIVGLDFVPEAPFHSDLDQGAWLANANGNVLCAGALPLAAYLADELVLLGFDGRDPNHDKDVPYFWLHDAKSNRPDWESQVPLVNPAVFSRDFAAYLQNHEREVTRLFGLLKAQGKRVRRLRHSHIPPIAALEQWQPPPQLRVSRG